MTPPVFRLPLFYNQRLPDKQARTITKIRHVCANLQYGSIPSKRYRLSTGFSTAPSTYPYELVFIVYDFFTICNFFLICVLSLQKGDKVFNLDKKQVVNRYD